MVAAPALAVLTFFGFILYWAYLMEIEDHYGDLQDFYFASNSGDIIIKPEQKKIGFIQKDYKRILVIENQKEIDLYSWVYFRDKEYKVAVYRSENELLHVPDLDYNQIQQLIKEEKLKLVINN